MGVTNKTADFLSKFPLGKVPALECADGFCIAEGAAICRYLAASGPAADQLLGSARDPQAGARISEWSFFAENELAANANQPAYMVLFKFKPFDEKLYSFHVAAFERALQKIELALKGGKQYLVGDQLTLADIMVYGPLVFALSFLLDADMRKAAPETSRYLLALSEQAVVKEAFGELKMIDARLK
jgi:elongation factor 1-gamma